MTGLFSGTEEARFTTPSRFRELGQHVRCSPATDGFDKSRDACSMLADSLGVENAAWRFLGFLGGNLGGNLLCNAARAAGARRSATVILTQHRHHKAIESLLFIDA